MALKIEGKNVPHLCFRSVPSRWWGLTRTMHTKQRKATPTQFLQLHVKFMFMPCYFSIHRVYFFNIWFGMVQHQKQVGCREGRNIGQNIPILQSWRRLPLEFTQTVGIILLFSSIPSHFVAVRFVWFIKKIQLTVQVCCLFYFVLNSRFYYRVAFGGFYWVFQVGFFWKNLGGFFLVGSNYINPD